MKVILTDISFSAYARYLGFRKSILLDRRKLVELLDLHLNKTMAWDEFSHAVRTVHKQRMGQPTRRKIIPERPKEEDYFYANPQECLEHFNSQPINDHQWICWSFCLLFSWIWQPGPIFSGWSWASVAPSHGAWCCYSTALKRCWKMEQHSPGIHQGL